ncbi:hypothetical protein H0486_01105 [Lachnospiraceae bacterium MD1]|jgi:hypothetical protein|uniref:Uncharacterized protein n=1 Tax=Variimorphobacter saccharofermentans TaxID=2755051 RepID=A0A839JYD6_9FIRM|nr:hypothetical protein [Variimorphobacter saccharofermentans]MBB2181491.1 hypothetical protein [Variimorphobacter saccharofermentans]
MAKNKNNNYKNSSSYINKSNATNSSKEQSVSSIKDSHAQVPDKGTGRSGPGGN